MPKPLSIRLYVGSTAAGAVIVASLTLHAWGAPAWKSVAFFYVLHLLGLATSVEVPISGLSLVAAPQRPVTLSPGFIVLLTAAYTVSPSTTVLVALIPSLPVSQWRDRPDVARLTFNSSQEAISFAAAAAVFTSVRPLIGGVPGLFFAAIAAATTAEVLNTTLVAGVVTLDRGIRFRDAARRMAWTIPHSLSFALAALLIATLYHRFGPPAAVFLFMPLVALRFVRQAKVDLDAAHDRTIREFVRAVERKDPYTRNHSERVAEIVVALHRQLGTPDRDLVRRYYAAMLHDVGKVVVPTEILRKPGSLTADEYDGVKRHVTAGAGAVRAIDWLADLADEVLLHHERLDGRGYPYGLHGGEIPRNARILAVADCFEAMTSHRLYRRALTKQEALDELGRVTGTQLDPEAVAALIKVLEAGMVFATTSGQVISEDETQAAVGAR